ncbi:MAG TPA: M15 family metallopeptidase [Woeseiaceae bacterium]|nr:M15 family metallopeptidase [Woeseiaceae bacterium]
MSEPARSKARSFRFVRAVAIVFALLPGAEAAAQPQVSAAETVQEAGLIDITTLVPDIIVDMRYADSNNFIGQRIDGYHAPRCFLLKPVAQALQRVELALRNEDWRLKIFDCYRPARAVRHFVEWAGDPDDQRNKAHYYPNVDKSELLGAYIAPVSGHSRGATVDLTLVLCERDGENCATPDMGTSYDFFDERAHTDSPNVTEDQRENRYRLKRAMEREGFRNYELEWWHYTLTPEPTPGTMYDAPVR